MAWRGAWHLLTWRAARGPVAFLLLSQSSAMMRGKGVLVMFSLLTLASILENSQTYALYALPSHWMGQPKFKFYSPIMATPEPSTQPAPEQKGTNFIDDFDADTCLKP